MQWYKITVGLCWIMLSIVELGQAQVGNSSVPTAIYIGNAVFEAPIKGAKIALTLQESFGNQKRPVSTFIGEYVSDTSGIITVSLIPNKNYLIQTSKAGYYTQLSKVKTTNFSRTRQNKKGISLRPRNIITIKGNIAMTEGGKGQVTLVDKETGYRRSERLDEDGNYLLKAVKEVDYDLHVYVEGLIDTLVFLDKEMLNQTSGNLPVIYDFVPNAPRANFRKGEPWALEKYNLRFIERTTRPSSEVWMDTLARVLRDYPKTVLSLSIHTDARKSDRLNLILSRKRATILAEELEERGVNAQQYTFELKAEDEILNDCVDGVRCNKRAHEINNRVTIEVAEGAFYFKEE
ncbi:MAG: hypothetical protein ACRBFS_00090 [Aureispira sp.]